MNDTSQGLGTRVGTVSCVHILRDTNNSIMYRGLRAPLLRLRSYPGIRRGRNDWRTNAPFWILKLLTRCGFLSFSDLKLYLIDSLSVVILSVWLFCFCDCWSVIVIDWDWVNGHWSGTRNPVQIRWWVWWRRPHSLVFGLAASRAKSPRWFESTWEGFVMMLWLWLWYDFDLIVWFWVWLWIELWWWLIWCVIVLSY